MGQLASMTNTTRTQAKHYYCTWFCYVAATGKQFYILAFL